MRKDSENTRMVTISKNQKGIYKSKRKVYNLVNQFPGLYIREK